VQQLRHAADAILTSIGTVLADDPTLTDRSGLPRRRPLLRVIVDSNLTTPLDSQLVRSAHDDVLLLCASAADAARALSLQQYGVQIARLPALSTGRLRLDAVLAHLGERQLLNVLVEAGSRLNGAILHANLVDKLVLFHAPAALGPGALPFAEGIASPQHLEQNLQHSTRATFGPDTCVTGYLHYPWPGQSQP
jgi:diaminohydroxyphosphoribosylaminopyrimidine deaminase/5-amino-6-(5-phosphoribosylamino)uracil reductase